jgi:hypothetical protein
MLRKREAPRFFRSTSSLVLGLTLSLCLFLVGVSILGVDTGIGNTVFGAFWLTFSGLSSARPSAAAPSAPSEACGT